MYCGRRKHVASTIFDMENISTWFRSYTSSFRKFIIENLKLYSALKYQLMNIVVSICFAFIQSGNPCTLGISKDYNFFF